MYISPALFTFFFLGSDLSFDFLFVKSLTFFFLFCFQNYVKKYGRVVMKMYE